VCSFICCECMCVSAFAGSLFDFRVKVFEVSCRGLKLETPNPDIESGKSHGKVEKAVKGVKGLVDWVLAEDLKS